jgi:hypothetical protein
VSAVKNLRAASPKVDKVSLLEVILKMFQTQSGFRVTLYLVLLISCYNIVQVGISCVVKRLLHLSLDNIKNSDETLWWRHQKNLLCHLYPNDFGHSDLTKWRVVNKIVIGCVTLSRCLDDLKFDYVVWDYWENLAHLRTDLLKRTWLPSLEGNQLNSS